ncbi:MAG: alpha/beta hydrolase [Cyclobacteriaceae bacterium]
MHQYQILERGQPLHKAKKAIILLHGRGATAQDIMSLADEFSDDSFYLAAPQATNHTWYPYGFMAAEANNEPWLSSAIDTVKKLIDDVAKEIGQENLYVMGFSQGACLTLEVTARYPGKYAGIASFTGGLIGEKVIASRYKGDFKETAVFIGNSDVDPHVPRSRSEDSARIFMDLNAKVNFKVYPGMPHTINTDEIRIVKEIMF